MNNGVTYERQKRIGKNHRAGEKDLGVTVKVFYRSLSRTMDYDEINSLDDFLIREDVGEKKKPHIWLK